MAKNCLLCIYYELCQDEIFPCDEIDCFDYGNDESDCESFIDFDFEIDYPERSEGEHYWSEMSFRRYSDDDRWNFAPTEWELSEVE